MEKVFLVPITKGPQIGGRFGPVKYQDWYRTLLLTKKLLLKKYKGAKVLVICDLHIKGTEHEGEYYRKTLLRLGVGDGDIILIRRGLATMEQIEMVVDFAKQQNAKLVFVSTFLHYPQILYLMRGREAEHHWVVGIPAAIQALADIVMMFAVPFADAIGRREDLKAFIKKRRDAGNVY